MNRPLDPQVGNQERLFPKGQDPKSFIRSIPLDIILTIVTFGLFNLYVQHQQMRAVNVMVGQENTDSGFGFFLSYLPAASTTFITSTG